MKLGMQVDVNQRDPEKRPKERGTCMDVAVIRPLEP